RGLLRPQAGVRAHRGRPGLGLPSAGNHGWEASHGAGSGAGPRGRAGGPGPRTTKAAELGVPLDPEVAVQLNGAAMLAAGAALALGIWPRLAAGVLAGSLVPTTLAGHPYWQEKDPAARRQQRTHFFKNVGLLGGALLVLSERPAR